MGDVLAGVLADPELDIFLDPILMGMRLWPIGSYAIYLVAFFRSQFKDTIDREMISRNRYERRWNSSTIPQLSKIGEREYVTGFRFSTN